jgi:hypothetical protein
MGNNPTKTAKESRIQALGRNPQERIPILKVPRSTWKTVGVDPPRRPVGEKRASAADGVQVFKVRKPLPIAVYAPLLLTECE